MSTYICGDCGSRKWGAEPDHCRNCGSQNIRDREPDSNWSQYFTTTESPTDFQHKED